MWYGERPNTELAHNSPITGRKKSNNTGCHWDITNATIGGYPCVHGPPYIPDKNGNCPPPMYVRSPASQSNVSCGQILCYDLGWNRGQDSGFVDQHCPAAVDTLPVSVDNITIVNRGQVDAYCNGFSDGEQALANHPGVRSHVSSMVLPHNATGYSDTLKIMPNGSAAEIGRPHIINQTHIGTAAASINPDGTDVALMNCDRPGYTPCWDLGHLQMGCPDLSNGNKSQADNYCLGFNHGQIDLANQQQQNRVIK